MLKDRFKHLFVFLFLAAALLSVFVPFLHNHEPDLHEHEDCPAYVLAIVFSVAIVAIFFFSTISIPCQSVYTYIFPILFSAYLFIRPTRAPPNFSF